MIIANLPLLRSNRLLYLQLHIRPYGKVRRRARMPVIQPNIPYSRSLFQEGWHRSTRSNSTGVPNTYMLHPFMRLIHSSLESMVLSSEAVRGARLPNIVVLPSDAHGMHWQSSTTMQSHAHS